MHALLNHKRRAVRLTVSFLLGCAVYFLIGQVAFGWTLVQMLVPMIASSLALAVFLEWRPTARRQTTSAEK